MSMQTNKDEYVGLCYSVQVVSDLVFFSNSVCFPKKTNSDSLTVEQNKNKNNPTKKIQCI